MADPRSPQPSAQRAPEPKVQYWESPFVYEVDFTSTGGNAAVHGTTQNGAIQIQADSDFKWIKSVYTADIAAAAFTQSTQPIPNCTVQITDQGSGRVLFSNPIPVPAFFGFGYLPALLPIAYIFRARSSVSVQITNYDAAADYNLRLSFVGTKIFRGGLPQA